MRIVFMGTDEFGIPSIEKLRSDGHVIAGVVTTPPKPKGRGLKVSESPVHIFAIKNGISHILTPEKLNEYDFLLKLKNISADLFVVVAFRILPTEVFTMPPKGTINIHASLLPKYRGPAPIQRAIEAGETRTGISIFSIDKGVDTGKIILQREADIGPKETSPELYRRLSFLGAEALAEAVGQIESGQVSYVVQDEGRASTAPKLLKEEAIVQWQDKANTLFNRIRAFKPFPGTYTLFNGYRLAIEWAEPVAGVGGAVPGTICAVSDQWFDVQCGVGALRILEVKPEGRKQMSAAAFMNGTRVCTGMVMG